MSDVEKRQTDDTGSPCEPKMVANRGKRSRAGNLLEEVVSKELEEEFYRKAIENYKYKCVETTVVAAYEEEDVISDLEVEQYEHFADEPKYLLGRRFMKGYTDPLKQKKFQGAYRGTKFFEASLTGKSSIFEDCIRTKKNNLLVEIEKNEKNNAEKFYEYLKAEKERREEVAKKPRTNNAVAGPKVVFYSTIRDNETRNFINYSRNDDFFNDISFFQQNDGAYGTKSKLVRTEDISKCAITGEPAKYLDPLTGKPFATVEAFKALRKV
eukprot:Nk52_evm42s156 gene=Nk52_evmTU42s156